MASGSAKITGQPDTGQGRPGARSQTAVFSKVVRDVMGRAPLSVPSGTSCAEAVARMAQSGASGAVVLDSAGRVAGILTERDVVARVAFQLTGEVAVDRVMTAPVMTISDDDYLYHAIAHMRRRRLRHMPVVDGAGALVGTLDLHEALAMATERLMNQIDRLTAESTTEGLRDVKSAQVELAEDLFQDNLPAPDIQALITHVNNDIYRRIVDTALSDMATEGWGEPPVAFSVIVMGSGGRGENYLFPDQDNGFILEDYPDDAHNRIDQFFVELAERMTRELDAVGFPFCNGYVMAVNPLWRKTISQWKEQIQIWARRHDSITVRLSDIFFDFQSVWGRRDLAAELRDFICDVIPRNHFFLQAMYQEEADHNVALGLFGRFLTEKEDPGHRGEINLKHTGTIPLVEAVRLMALREGLRETPTLRRIDALHAAEVLDGNEHEYLTAAFTVLTNILLRQQLRDFRAGRKVGNFVDPRDLSKREREELLDAFRVIDTLRKRVRTEFTADVF